MRLPVVACTRATKPSLLVPIRMYQTGAGKRCAAPSDIVTGFAAFFGSFSQSPAFVAAALYAASESIVKSLVAKVRASRVGPAQFSVPSALTPLVMVGS